MADKSLCQSDRERWNLGCITAHGPRSEDSTRFLLDRFIDIEIPK